MTSTPARLDGSGLRQALRAGIARVLAEAGMLNRINVYPVPDGDTGTNLSLTLGAVDEALAALPAAGAGETLAAAADAALDAARGNSGAIVAELLQGLADATGERADLDVATLARAFASADRYARGALDSPQEGTILTVVSAVARCLLKHGRGRPGDLREALAAAVDAAEAAVAETRDTLPAMRRAGVEDAGARGFLLFLQGFVEVALGREPAAREKATATTADSASHESVPGQTLAHAAGAVDFRFCTECVVTGPGIDRRKLHDALAALGGSLVMAGSRDKVKVHIHADDPGTVFEAVRRFGMVAGEKADDMRRQAQSRARPDRGVAVVTDSGADLPEEVCEELGIHMVPLRIHFADRTFLDKVSLTPAGFLREVEASPHHPQTSQPAPGDLRRVYEFLASHHEHVVAVSLDARVSGTWQAARAAARRCAAPDRITVIDSCNASVGQGLVAMFAAECARAGLPLAELLAAVHRAVAATRSYGVVSDLGYAVRGGRLPRALRWLTLALPVRPVLSMGGGAVRVRGVTLRGRDPVDTLLRHLTARLAGGSSYRFAVAHTGMPDEATALAAALREGVPGHAGVLVSELGAAASVHSGPGTLAVAVQEYVAPSRNRAP